MMEAFLGVLGIKKIPLLRNIRSSGIFFLREGEGEIPKNYFFWTYFKQSSITATRMMMPENTNCRLVSMPRVVRE